MNTSTEAVVSSSGSSQPLSDMNPVTAQSASGKETVRTEGLFRWWDYAIFSLLSVATLTSLAAFLQIWVTLPGWRSERLMMIAASVLLVRYVLVHQLRWFSLLVMRRPCWMAPQTGLNVAAVTTFVPGVESTEMLERTLRAMCEIHYPHETWVLDEGDAQAIKDLCARLGVHHFSRRGRAEYDTSSGPFTARTKYGNYNAWFAQLGSDRYDYVTYFDPDHVPYPEYLDRVMGYFRDPKVAYVQPAQMYYNQDASFIARGAAEETYSYYSTMQMAYNGLGHPMVTGCHQSHRVTALKEIGGLAAHDADDLLTTHVYRAGGWQGVYVPEVLAVGITPVDWPGYLKQQQRWAHSVLDIKLRRLKRLAPRMPMRDSLVAFLHGLYYLQGVTTFASIVLLCAIMMTGSVPSFFRLDIGLSALLLLVMLRGSEFYKQRFFVLRRREWGLHLRAGILQFAKWPFLLRAFADAVAGRDRPYVLTQKLKTRHGKPRMLTWPHTVTIGAVIVAFVVGYVQGAGVPWFFHLWAAILTVVGALLIWTESWRYPAEYDDQLYRDYEASRRSGS